jgi:hypothetical protein
LPERETSLVAGSMLNPTLASLLDEEKDARRVKNRGLINKLIYPFSGRAVITCPRCGMPEWEALPAPYTYRYRGPENTVMIARCKNCGLVFYIFRTSLDTFTLEIEKAERKHGAIPHIDLGK